jgi:hypothetical protein
LEYFASRGTEFVDVAEKYGEEKESSMTSKAFGL